MADYAVGQRVLTTYGGIGFISRNVDGKMWIVDADETGLAPGQGKMRPVSEYEITPVIKEKRAKRTHPEQQSVLLGYKSLVSKRR